MSRDEYKKKYPSIDKITDNLLYKGQTHLRATAKYKIRNYTKEYVLIQKHNLIYNNNILKSREWKPTFLGNQTAENMINQNGMTNQTISTI